MHGCYQELVTPGFLSLLNLPCPGQASAIRFGSVQGRQVKQDSKDPLPLPTFKNGKMFPPSCCLEKELSRKEAP